MTKQQRRNTRQKRKDGLQSRIARIATGIPTVNKTSSDPPLIPTHLDYTIRTRFVMRYEGFVPTVEAFRITDPENSWDTGTIIIFVQSSSSESTEVFMDKERAYNAATMRAFGGIFSYSPPGSALDKLNSESEFAIQSVTVWGAETVGTAQSLSLRVDFGTGTPGFAGSDTGDRMSRARLKATNSRLTWEKYGSMSPTNRFLSVNLNPPNIRSLASLDLGIIDIVVLIRRSYDAFNTSP